MNVTGQETTSGARIERVGMVGLGLMGSAIAVQVLNKGFRLSALAHRSRTAIDALVAQGATESASAAELARNADVIIICVTGTPQVRDVVFREDGLLAGAHEGLIVIDSSTSDPEFAKEAAAAFERKGACFLDAPVNRTPKEAREGRLNVLVGGEAGVLDRVRPLMAAYAETVHHLGGHGAGYCAKLVHNFIAQANGAILAEAFGTAAKAGLDLHEFAAVCRLSGAHSKTFDRIVPYLLEGDDSGQQFAIRNAAKDMRSYAQLASAQSSTAVIAEAVRQMYVLATNLGHGDAYVPRMFDVLRELNGMPVSSSADVQR
ncbi:MULTISPECIES: NAD(P)-dependent oxidoreductase [unclassified Caballeronia]|uniref:NAD(P)-dependent oxidoreductase n=1 Tax=unclassified Caballeronia TaxID=2646786 RepID=UPI00285CF1B2|nr:MULTISPECIES: NAD(P)-dependent oxidoreductase [unclassified Caballeronia]MDR5814183.1 NAD(P)-dependent oxidoreductase [Caballeronia sp. LZ033]MDR5878730.1 NAD(P)-dependent oxidoreductase [Caballeronia sp. LZ032]